MQESEILTNFNQLREQVRIISSKCNDIEAECSEHEQVLKALQPLDKSRKCYRLIGGVLVERTVGEVTPAVEGNCEQLRMLTEKLNQQLQNTQKELQSFMDEYKIRMKGEEEEQQPQKHKSSDGVGQSQGVLV
eukprot:jgi/Astpho2/8936/Aster-02616